MMELFSRRGAITTGAVAVLAAGLGLTGYVVARAASGSPGTPAAATASSASKGSGSGSAPRGNWQPGSGPGKGFGKGFGGMRRPGGFGFAGGGASGTVDHVGASSFTLKSHSGATLTIDTTSKTTYYEALSKVSASALQAGENVVVLFKSPAGASSGSTTASSASSPRTAAQVEIVLPSLSGEVLSDSGGTIVVADQQGFHRTIITSGATRYDEGGSNVSAGSVADGTDIVAYGAIASDRTDLDATVVEIVGPNVAGTVTKISGSTITLTPLRGGAAETVTTSSTTVFRTKGATSSLKALKRGDVLVAIGVRTSSTSFAASVVQFGAAGSGLARGGRAMWGAGHFGGRAPGGSFGSAFAGSIPPGLAMGAGMAAFGVAG